MDLLKALIAFIVSLVMMLSGHGAATTPPNSPAATATPMVQITSYPTQASSQPTESGCPQEGSIKSPSSYNAASVTFDNKTAGDLKVYWIDFDGKRKLYYTLKAHTTYTQATWIGHVWVVANGADQCVKLESANAVAQTLVID